MKKIYLMLALLLSFGVSQAQLNNVLCPDFTVTDRDGTVWDISDLLDDGYTIVLDIFEHWCGPCWNYMETGALDEAWENLGPDGAGKLIVLSIETDPTTTEADMNGTASGTVGDWVGLIQNPLAQSPPVAGLLGVTSIPAIFKVCPADRKIYTIGQAPFPIILEETFNSDCSVTTDVTDGWTAGYNGAMEVCNGAGDQAVEIYNLGSDDLSAFEVEVYVGGSMQTSTPWTGSLSSFEKTDLMVPQPFLTATEEVSFKVVAPGDAKASNDEYSTSLDLSAENAGDQFEVFIRTDQYGYETYWDFTDEAGTIVASGGNTAVGPDGGGLQVASAAGPGAYAANSNITENVTVPSEGCYQFRIVDDWGDGICCGFGSGYYEVRDIGANVMVEGAGFGPRALHGLRQGMASGVPSLEAISGMTVYPNPATNMLQVQVEGSASLEAALTITNVMGQVVEQRTGQSIMAGSNLFSVDVSNLPTGMYHVTLANQNGQNTATFSVTR